LISLSKSVGIATPIEMHGVLISMKLGARKLGRFEGNFKHCTPVQPVSNFKLKECL